MPIKLLLKSENKKLPAYFNTSADEKLFNKAIKHDNILDLKFFNCRCGHGIESHKNRKGKCLVPTCSFGCFFFIEKQFSLEVSIKDLERKSFSESLNLWLQERFIPIPQNGAIRWKFYERWIKENFNGFYERKGDF